MISYGLWQTLFAGDVKAVGATIRLDGNPLTIIGVAPPGFDYPGKTVVWKPAAFAPGNNGWETVARLKPGITWPQARAAFAVEADRLWPDRTSAQRIKYPSTITGLQDELAGPARKGSLVLMACVVLILLIACTNVANLLMARTADRATELSIRSALGASRARMYATVANRMCASFAGGVYSRGFSSRCWTASVAAAFQPAALASQAYSILDGRVLGFAVIASVVSGLFFGDHAVVVRQSHPLVRNSRLQRYPGLAPRSRNVGGGAGDAHDRSSGFVDFRRPGICPSHAHRSRV